MAQLGLSMNRFIEKYIAFIVMIVMAIGLSLGERLYAYSWLVPYLFAYVTLSMAIGCSMKDMREVLRQPLKMALLLLIIHLILPIFVYAISGLIFGYESPYVIGLVMFTLIPVGISAVMWVSMTGGNISLILAFVVIDSLLSPFIIAGGLRLFFHRAVEIDTLSMLTDLLMIVVVPTILGIALNEFTKGRIAEKVKPYSAPLSKLCFLIVIALNAAALATSLDQLKGDLVKIIPFSIAIVIITYIFGYYSAWRDSAVYKITMSYAAGIRNVSLGAVIALTYFTPQTAVPILVGILLQQPLATVIGLFLQKLNNAKPSQTV